MLNQLQSLLEKLKTNNKWIIISQNQPLLRDSLEKFMEIRDLTERERQIIHHQQNVDKCKRVLEWLPSTSEPVSEELITADKEFFTQLLEILEAAVKKLEEMEKVEAEFEEVKRNKEELSVKLSESETTLTETRQELDNKEQELDGLREKLSGEQTKSGELEGQLTGLVASSGLLSQQ
ncbi:14280_t:CDS:2, partial [Racocetra fulgida]